MIVDLFERSNLAEKDLVADEMAAILKMWRGDPTGGGGGVALLDEVDLLLHPLKSELNFPIGEKEPLDGSPHRWNFAVHLLVESWSSKV